MRLNIAHQDTQATLMTWGASLLDFRLAEVSHSLVLGGPEFEAYLGPMRYFGAIVGRVANRIAGGCTMLGGRVLKFDRNENGRTTLHGGSTGSGQRNWRLVEYDRRSCSMSLKMLDNQDGFPGNLTVNATYSIDENGAMVLDLEAKTDADTLCNFAHHSYWSLDGTADLSAHSLKIKAERYLPVDEILIPCATPALVVGTEYDFCQLRHLQPTGNSTLDHNFCLNEVGVLHRACTLSAGGVQLDIDTTAPGLQVYNGKNIATAPYLGHGGVAYGAYAGVALEPQHWPDAPNHLEYPQITLHPDERYHQISRFHVRLV
jgi:aldose 1-epimerase